jgi:polyhydroxybutyrate depolymerase
MHGYTSFNMEMEVMSNFDQVASEDGFVVVYPEGLGRSWNAGWCCGRNTYDDVGFISALIDKVAGEQNIDRRRILATGMSNGAMMAQRLGCELADRITAVVSVSGSLLLHDCHPVRPISVMEMHGDSDELVPIGGGLTPGIGTFRPTMSVMQEWASLDGCTAAPAIADDASAITYRWSACQAGSKVTLEVVKGGGHAWFGPSLAEPDASRLGWDFFIHAPALN